SRAAPGRPRRPLQPRSCPRLEWRRRAGARRLAALPAARPFERVECRGESVLVRGEEGGAEIDAGAAGLFKEAWRVSGSPPHPGRLRGWSWCVIAAFLAATLATAGFALRHLRSLQINRLLSAAYVAQRPAQFRIPGAGHTRVRTRDSRAMAADRPQELLDAQALIGRMLLQDRGNSAALALRGRAYLLEGAYEAALSDLQQALGGAPGSPTFLGDLASAFTERAEAEGRFSVRGLAFELQSRAL